MDCIDDTQSNAREAALFCQVLVLGANPDSTAARQLPPGHGTRRVFVAPYNHYATGAGLWVSCAQFSLFILDIIASANKRGVAKPV